MGVSPLAMMGMHEQYPWMKEKKSSRKNQMGGESIVFVFIPLGYGEVTRKKIYIDI